MPREKGPATEAAGCTVRTRTGKTSSSFTTYFHGDDGRGLGASHQTGWTALVTRCIEDLAGHPTEQSHLD